MAGLENVIVEQTDPEISSRCDSPTSSDRSVRPVEFPPPSMATQQPMGVPRKKRHLWKLVMSGTVLSISGVACGTYLIKNIESPRGWAATSFVAGAIAAAVVGKSLSSLYSWNILSTQTQTDLEAQRIQALLDQNLVTRRHFNQPPLNLPSPEDSSFPSSPAVSQLSADVLAVERKDYRPNTSELSFRQRQADRAKKYQKYANKKWNSAPPVLQGGGQSQSLSKDIERASSLQEVGSAVIEEDVASGQKVDVAESQQTECSAQKIGLDSTESEKLVGSEQGIDVAVANKSQDIEDHNLVPAESPTTDGSEQEISLDPTESPQTEGAGKQTNLTSTVSKATESTEKNINLTSARSEEVLDNVQDINLAVPPNTESIEQSINLASPVPQQTEGSEQEQSLGSDMSSLSSQSSWQKLSLGHAPEGSEQVLNLDPTVPQESESSSQEISADKAESELRGCIVKDVCSSLVASVISEEESWQDLTSDSQESDQEFSLAPESDMNAARLLHSPVNGQGGHQENISAPAESNPENVVRLESVKVDDLQFIDEEGS